MAIIDPRTHSQSYYITANIEPIAPWHCTEHFRWKNFISGSVSISYSAGKNLSYRDYNCGKSLNAKGTLSVFIELHFVFTCSVLFEGPFV